jgi:hypothetical protein
MMRARHLPLLVIAFGGATVISESAHASGIAVAAELGPLVTVGNSGMGSSTGFGFAGRFGYRISLPLLKLTPEVKLAYDRVPYGATVGTFRGMAGARLALLEGFTPLAFAHIGYASGSGSEGGIDAEIKGLAYDAGIGLDFTLIPFIDLGIYGSYNRVENSGAAVNWLTAGVQASLTF